VNEAKPRQLTNILKPKLKLNWNKMNNRAHQNVEGSQTVSITFGDAGENHVGMEMIGERGSLGDGFTCEELVMLADHFGGEFVDMGRGAGVAVFRGFVGELERDAIFKEMNSFDWDDKYFDSRRKKVLNKHARTNVMFLNGVSQEPQYEEKKGRIVDINGLQNFSGFKDRLMSSFSEVIGPKKMSGLICEGNNYYDNKKCGIGYHGDAERRRVIALRLGASMSMKWQWFHRSVPIVGEGFDFVFDPGDIYVMSEKAVGTDWRSSSIPTMRHSAGCEKYTKLPVARDVVQPQPYGTARETAIEIDEGHDSSTKRRLPPDAVGANAQSKNKQAKNK
jgi:hypothetical protein